eukprot:SAG25_NODE_13_length_24452_cov_18.893976_8_plen_47_part_00
MQIWGPLPAGNYLWIGVICKLVYLVLVSNSQLGLDSGSSALASNPR